MLTVCCFTQSWTWVTFSWPNPIRGWIQSMSNFGFTSRKTETKQLVISYATQHGVSLSSWLILPQFSRHEAEDQVTTRCIKSRVPGQTSTNTLSFRQLYLCGMHYQHRWSSLGHSSYSKQASVITTATEPRHVTIGHQCAILVHRGLHFTGRWRWNKKLDLAYQSELELNIEHWTLVQKNCMIRSKPHIFGLILWVMTAVRPRDVQSTTYVTIVRLYLCARAASLRPR